MRVVKLEAENFKRLTAVEITPDGNVQVIAGANANGKSSVLDAIAAAIDSKFAKGIERPIRDGADRATVRVDLGDLVVTRQWRNDGKPSLEVTLASGAPVRSPQKVLDDLVGKLSFDPLQFASAKPAEQRALLLEVAGLAETWARLDAKEREAYEERTFVNREVKRLEGAVANLPEIPADAPTEAVSVVQLAGQLQALEQQQNEFDRLANDVVSIQGEIAQLEQRLADMKVTREGFMERGRQLRDPQRQEKITALVESITLAEQRNLQVSQRRQSDALHAELAAKREEADGLTGMVVGAREAKALAASAADLPVPGLGVDEDGVTFNGVPFSQASSAEQMRVSLAMAMRLNPKLRVIRLENASLLDSVSRALVQQMADENDYQIWLEVVDESKSVGVVIEDGAVRTAEVAA